MEWKDEIVEEVRAAREAYFAQCGYDLARMFADLKEKEKLHPERVVSPPARQSAPDDSAPDSANRPSVLSSS